jgi:hypothetical protein
MPSALRIGYPSASQSVAWSDGTAFNGYALVGFNGLIDGAGTAWPSISLGNRFAKRTIPVARMLPIIEGKFDQSSWLYFNADVTPPGSQYVAYFYDTNDKQVAGWSSAFRVTATGFTVPTPSLPAPSAGSTFTPDT